MAVSSAVEVPDVTAPSYVAGQLTWQGVSLTAIADQHGTPCHVGSVRAVLQSVEAFSAPFRRRGLPLQVRYSVKTNPVPTFLRALAEQGVGFEVLASHELELLHALGVDGSRILVSSMVEGPALARRAHELGVAIVGVSTPGQLTALLAVADRFERTQAIAISICPELRRGAWDLTLNTASAAAATGFRCGSPELEQALQRVRAHPRLKLRCLHMHLGSGIRSATPYARGLATLESLARQARALGHPIDALDLGGGYGLPSAPILGALRTLAALLGRGRAGGDAARVGANPLLEDVAELSARAIERLGRDGTDIRELIVEPGRALSGPCQLLLLTVTDVVERTDGRRHLLCDGGAMAISPLLLTEHHRVLALDAAEGATTEYDVLGHLPTTLDRVSAGALLPRMEPGDRIAVLDTGAYFVSTNNTFSGPRPPYVWIGEEGPTLARAREDLRTAFGL